MKNVCERRRSLKDEVEVSFLPRSLNVNASTGKSWLHVHVTDFFTGRGVYLLRVAKLSSGT